MDRIHIWSDDRYGSNVFLSTIPTPTHGQKVKVKFIVVKISLLPNLRLARIRIRSDDRKWFDP